MKTAAMDDLFLAHTQKTTNALNNMESAIHYWSLIFKLSSTKRQSLLINQQTQSTAQSKGRKKPR